MPTENIKADSGNISEMLKVHTTRLKETEPYKKAKKDEQTMQEKPISNISEVLRNSGNMKLSVHLLE